MPMMVAPQLDNGINTTAGAELESIRYANFARETR